MSVILLVNESQGRKRCVRNWYKLMTRPKYIAFHKDLSSQEYVGLCFTSLENKWPNCFVSWRMPLPCSHLPNWLSDLLLDYPQKLNYQTSTVNSSGCFSCCLFTLSFLWIGLLSWISFQQLPVCRGEATDSVYWFCNCYFPESIDLIWEFSDGALHVSWV